MNIVVVSAQDTYRIARCWSRSHAVYGSSGSRFPTAVVHHTQRSAWSRASALTPVADDERSAIRVALAGGYALANERLREFHHTVPIALNCTASVEVPHTARIIGPDQRVAIHHPTEVGSLVLVLPVVAGLALHHQHIPSAAKSKCSIDSRGRILGRSPASSVTAHLYGRCERTAATVDVAAMCWDASTENIFISRTTAA